MIEPTATGIRLRLHVQPRASRTEVAGRHGGAIKLRVAAAPVDGAANDAIVRFLADRLEVPRAAVHLDAGAGGRAKVVRVDGIDVAEAVRRLGL